MYNPEYSYTLQEYWKLLETFPEHKYEYKDGFVRMMTGGSLAHAQIEANITFALVGALRNRECNVYSSDAVVQLSEGRFYCPDVSVSCDPADWTRKVMESPTLIVEVISPSSEKIDKSEKLEVYKHFPAIQEILLVDSRRRSVEHYHRVGPHKWENSFYEYDSDMIELRSIDIVISVREIYRKVYLELEEAMRSLPAFLVFAQVPDICDKNSWQE